MDKRLQELTELKAHVHKIDKETTLLLQSLQWDCKNLIESKPMVCCNFISDHRMPLQLKEAHEKQCYLTVQGYHKEEVLLPDPVDPDANTVIKFSKQDIMGIISAASSSNPSFKRAPIAEPLSAERLQQTYTAGERRAIHDAVVTAAPYCHDLADLALPSVSSKGAPSSQKSRMEILAELRDMKRRRAKYRVASKTANYSDTLRHVIKTQMELYSEAKGFFIKTEYGSKSYISLNEPETLKTKMAPTNIVIKQERVSPESDGYSEVSRRHRDRSRSRGRLDRHDRKHDDRKYTSRNNRDHHQRNEVVSEKRKHKDYSEDRKEYYSREKRRDEDNGQWIEHKDKYLDSAKIRHYSKEKLNRETKTYKSHQSNSHYGATSSSCNERYEDEFSRDSSRYDNSKKHDDYKTSNKDSNKYREKQDIRYHDFKDKGDEYRETNGNKRYHDKNGKEKRNEYDHSHERKKRKRRS